MLATITNFRTNCISTATNSQLADTVTQSLDQSSSLIIQGNDDVTGDVFPFSSEVIYQPSTPFLHNTTVTNSANSASASFVSDIADIIIKPTATVDYLATDSLIIDVTSSDILFETADMPRESSDSIFSDSFSLTTTSHTSVLHNSLMTSQLLEEDTTLMTSFQVDLTVTVLPSSSVLKDDFQENSFSTELASSETLSGKFITPSSYYTDSTEVILTSKDIRFPASLFESRSDIIYSRSDSKFFTQSSFLHVFSHYHDNSFKQTQIDGSFIHTPIATDTDSLYNSFSTAFQSLPNEFEDSTYISEVLPTISNPGSRSSHLATPDDLQLTYSQNNQFFTFETLPHPEIDPSTLQIYMWNANPSMSYSPTDIPSSNIVTASPSLKSESFDSVSTKHTSSVTSSWQGELSTQINHHSLYIGSHTNLKSDISISRPSKVSTVYNNLVPSQNDSNIFSELEESISTLSDLPQMSQSTTHIATISDLETSRYGVSLTGVELASSVLGDIAPSKPIFDTSLLESLDLSDFGDGNVTPKQSPAPTTNGMSFSSLSLYPSTNGDPGVMSMPDSDSMATPALLFDTPNTVVSSQHGGDLAVTTTLLSDAADTNIPIEEVESVDKTLSSSSVSWRGHISDSLSDVWEDLSSTMLFPDGQFSIDAHRSTIDTSLEQLLPSMSSSVARGDISISFPSLSQLGDTATNQASTSDLYTDLSSSNIDDIYQISPSASSMHDTHEFHTTILAEVYTDVMETSSLEMDTYSLRRYPSIAITTATERISETTTTLPGIVIAETTTFNMNPGTTSFLTGSRDFSNAFNDLSHSVHDTSITASSTISNTMSHTPVKPTTTTTSMPQDSVSETPQESHSQTESGMTMAVNSESRHSELMTSHLDTPSTSHTLVLPTPSSAPGESLGLTTSLTSQNYQSHQSTNTAALSSVTQEQITAVNQDSETYNMMSPHVSMLTMFDELSPSSAESAKSSMGGFPQVTIFPKSQVGHKYLSVLINCGTERKIDWKMAGKLLDRSLTMG